MPWRRRRCSKQSRELEKQRSHGHFLDILILPHFTSTQLTLSTIITTPTQTEPLPASILSSIHLLFIQSPWHPTRPLLHSSAMTTPMLAQSCEKHVFFSSPCFWFFRNYAFLSEKIMLYSFNLSFILLHEFQTIKQYAI